MFTADEVFTTARARKLILESMEKAYEQLEDPDEAMTQDALNATQALLNLYPQLKENIDSNTGFFSDNTAAIRANIAALQDLAKQQAYQKLMESTNETLADLFVTKTDTQAKANELAKNLKEQQRLTAYYEQYATSPTGETPATITDFAVVKAMQERMGNFNELYSLNADGTASATKLGTEAALYAAAWKDLYTNSIAREGELTSGIEALQQQMAGIDAAVTETQTKAASLIDTFNSLYGTATTEAGAAASAANSVKTALDSIPGDYDANINLHINGGDPSGVFGDQPQTYNASGLGYVPYDNYVSRLHRGEMVLTRQQAEGYRQGLPAEAGRQYAVSASLNVGSMTLNNGMDAQRVAQALSRETTRQVRALGRRKG